MKEYDKVVHYAVATLISFALVNGLKNILALHWIFLILITGFLLFEVYQKVFKKGQFDWFDWAAGVAGAVVITLTAYINS